MWKCFCFFHLTVFYLNVPIVCTSSTELSFLITTTHQYDHRLLAAIVGHLGGGQIFSLAVLPRTSLSSFYFFFSAFGLFPMGWFPQGELPGQRARTVSQLLIHTAGCFSREQTCVVAWPPAGTGMELSSGDKGCCLHPPVWPWASWFFSLDLSFHNKRKELEEVICDGDILGFLTAGWFDWQTLGSQATGFEYLSLAVNTMPGWFAVCISDGLCCVYGGWGLCWALGNAVWWSHLWMPGAQLFSCTGCLHSVSSAWLTSMLCWSLSVLNFSPGYSGNVWESELSLNPTLALIAFVRFEQMINILETRLTYL